MIQIKENIQHSLFRSKSTWYHNQRVTIILKVGWVCCYNQPFHYSLFTQCRDNDVKRGDEITCVLYHPWADALAGLNSLGVTPLLYVSTSMVGVEVVGVVPVVACPSRM